MGDFPEAAIEAALRAELGRTAQFARYGRENRTPMTFVLDAVEGQGIRDFVAYWVDGGPPEVFSLTGLSPTPVVFSSRYLSVSAFARNLFSRPELLDLLDEVAERTTLKMMAEMALHHGNRDFAVLAFVKSAVGKGIWLDDGDSVMALEYEPKNEAYMATWFFGLLHEIGHIHPQQTESFVENHLFSDAGMREALAVALSQFTSYHDSLKSDALQRAMPGSGSVIALDHLRQEGLADIFAASTLFQTTRDIMREVGGKQFQTPTFALEMVIFLNIVTIVERCRRVAAYASIQEPNREVALELALQPVSVFVRLLMLRQYLQFAIVHYVYGENPTAENHDNVSGMLDEVMDHLRERIDKIERGVAAAMEFALFPARRDNEWHLLESFRRELADGPLLGMEAQRFIDLANTLGANSKLLTALRSILADPARPIQANPEGDLLYFIPWVDGPNGFSRPFGLNTKYGHLIFVFVEQGDLYEKFFGPSAESLKPGFTLKRAVLPVYRRERLEPELAARMPQGQSFAVIVQGTDDFARCMRELADDTIWPS